VRVNNRRIEVDVREEWDDTVFNANGTIVQKLPGRVEQHYVLESDGSPIWLITESKLARQN
jgi:hypothetical protein